MANKKNQADQPTQVEAVVDAGEVADGATNPDVAESAADTGAVDNAADADGAADESAGDPDTADPDGDGADSDGDNPEAKEDDSGERPLCEECGALGDDHLFGCSNDKTPDETEGAPSNAGDDAAEGDEGSAVISGPVLRALPVSPRRGQASKSELETEARGWSHVEKLPDDHDLSRWELQQLIELRVQQATAAVPPAKWAQWDGEWRYQIDRATEVED